MLDRASRRSARGLRGCGELQSIQWIDCPTHGACHRAIGATTAAALVIDMPEDMPELGAVSGKQAASLAGVAPVVRQSGRARGQAHIRGGRPALRRALYMPALVAIRFNPDLKAKADRLAAAGKPAKVVITAVMRNLLVIANTLIRDDRLWQPQTP